MDIAEIGQPPERPRKTALQKLQEDMQRQLAPLRQIQEIQDLVKRYSPSHQVQELLRQFEPHLQIQELLAHTAIPKHIQDVIDGTSIAAQARHMVELYFPKSAFAGLELDNELFRRAAGLTLNNEALRQAAGLSSISEVAKQYGQYVKPIREQHEYIDHVHRQAIAGLTGKELERQLEQANPTLRAIEVAQKSLDNLWGSFRDIDFSQFDAGEEYLQEAVKTAQDITLAVVAEPTLKEAVDQIIATIEAQQHPAVRFLLWLYFKKMMELLIAGAIGVVMSQYAPNVLGQSPQAETKAVKEIARQAIGAPELLMEYRYVSAKVVIVRQNPKARSPELARLAFGKPVKLLKKERGFALVAWSDKEAGVEIQGWVFSRYLAKFN